MEERREKLKYGLSLRFVIIVMFLIGSAVSVLLLLTMRRTTERYDELEDAVQDYIICQDDAYAVRDAITSLDEYALDFVITGNAEDVILYFNEVQVNRSMYTALEEIESYLADVQTIKHLNTAIALNDRMTVIQYSAMRLAAEAYEQDLKQYPDALQSVELPEEQLALSPEEQLAAARAMLFSRDYRTLQDQVDIRIGLCRTQLLSSMQQRHEAVSGQLDRLLKEQRELILALMVTLLVALIFVLALVVYPVTRLIAGIRAGDTLTVSGSSEIRFLADTYNEMLLKMEDANARLGYEASHDALTGLHNRSSYEELRKQNQNRNIALLVVDVDQFKEVNDTYGHDIGDRVLIRVAEVLTDSFREADKVCRIGGDEFCVIMMDVSSAITGVIRKKFAAAAEILSEPKDGIPPVTLSVGVAFSDLLKEGESLFKNADRALYRVKENGRNGCEFYL